MTRYVELFSITYMHEYFSQAGYLGLKCFLSKKTLQLFNNMGIIVRPFRGGCRLFFDEDFYKSAESLYALFSNENMTFIFYPEDKLNFYNYTAGFSAKKDGALLFAAGKKTIVDGGSVDLGTGKFTVFESSVFTLPEINEFRSRANTEIPVVFKINTDQLLKFSGSPSFKLKFKSIQTYYKYYVSDKFESQTLQVKDTGNNIEFVQKREELENGNVMHVFLSTSPISSQFKSKLNFQLLDNKSGAKKIIMSNMPMPKPGNYFTDQMNGEDVMVSEIFIN